MAACGQGRFPTAEYLLAVHHRADDPVPSEDEMMQAFADVDAFNTRLQESGSWVFAGGLTAPTDATVVDARGEKVITTDGPFIEAKEHLGGFWVIDVADLDAAIAVARDASVACKQPVEVRPFQGE